MVDESNLTPSEREEDAFFAPSHVPGRGRLKWLRLGWVVAGAIIAFLVSFTFLPPAESLRLANCLLFGMSVAVLTAYVPGLWNKDVSYTGRLVIIGICGTWTSSLEKRLVEMVWWDKVSGPVFTDGQNFLLFVSEQVLFTVTLAGAFHLAAPGAIRGVVPDRNWSFIGGALGIAAAAWALLKTA